MRVKFKKKYSPMGLARGNMKYDSARYKRIDMSLIMPLYENKKGSAKMSDSEAQKVFDGILEVLGKLGFTVEEAYLNDKDDERFIHNKLVK